MKHLFTIFAVAILLSATNLYAETYFVHLDGDDSNSGTSWSEAFATLQQALVEAGSGDEIWVAEGTYYPTTEVGGSGERFRTFQMKNGVTIYGGFPASGNPGMGARDWTTYETILSGDIGTEGDNSDNCYHVFYHPNGTNLNSTAILNGFTITAGNANGSNPHNIGGGMYNESSSPTISNCTFTGNTASFIGGGMYNYESSPSIINCSFSSNSANWDGAGMYNEFSSPSLINCSFSNNSASLWGGGMFNYASSPVIINCSFSNNSAVVVGGGMYNDESSPTISNSTFSSNSADQGGGIFSDFSSLIINNSIIWGNNASSEGHQFFMNGGTTTLNYSCYANGDNDVYVINSGIFSATNNNITDDPLFVGSGDHPFSLEPTSPCINTGSNDLIPEGITTDIIGNPRIAFGTVDMGAYEYSIIVSISPNEITDICYDSPVDLVAGIGEITIDGGEAPYSYSWSPSFLVEHTDPSSPVATLTRAIRDAVYTLTVTDANGMQGTATVSVETSPWVELPSLVVHRFHAEDIENPLNLYELVFGVGVGIDNYMNDLIYGEGEGDEIPQQPFTYCVRFVDRFTGDYFQNPSEYIPNPNSRQYLWVEVTQEGLQPPPNGGEGICYGCLVAKRRLNIVVRGNELGIEEGR